MKCKHGSCWSVFVELPELVGGNDTVMHCVKFADVINCCGCCLIRIRPLRGRVDVLDSSIVVAESLQNYLIENDLLNRTGQPKHHFFVSDYTEAFEASTGLFFQEKVTLERHPLWN